MKTIAVEMEKICCYGGASSIEEKTQTDDQRPPVVSNNDQMLEHCHNETPTYAVSSATDSLDFLLQSTRF